MDVDYTRNKLIEIIKEKGISEKFLSMPGVMERIAEDRANMLEDRIFLNPNTAFQDGKATSFTYSTMDDRFMKFEMMEDGKVRILAIPRQSGEKYPEEAIILNEYGIDVGRGYAISQSNYSIISRGEGIIEEKYYIQNKGFSTYNFLDTGNWQLADFNRSTLGMPISVSYSDQEKDSKSEKTIIMSDKELESIIRRNSEKIVLRYPNCKDYFENLIPKIKEAYKTNMLIISEEYRKNHDKDIIQDK